MPPKNKKGRIMKSIMFTLVLFALSFTAAAQNNYINAVGTVKTRVAQYVTVVNSASAALTVGQAVCLDLTADDGISVDYCYAEGAKPLGVVTDTSCAVGARCKLQTKGYFAYGKFDYAATATVAGGMIYADVDGDLTRPASVTTAMAPLGVTLDAVSADSSALEIYIDL